MYGYIVEYMKLINDLVKNQRKFMYGYIVEYMKLINDKKRNIK